MHSYRAYGLGIQSVLSLPELVTAKTASDVTIRRGSVDRTPPGEAHVGNNFWATPPQTCLFYDQVGALLVRGGREIIIDADPGVEERVLRLFILGPALALILHQRGRLILHASAAAIERAAAAFMGGPGWGKSTMAAALHARGHGLVADDVVPVEVGESDFPKVYPGFPQLKLWPDTATSLGEALEQLPRLHPRLEKRARRATQRFAQESLPLKRVYVLAEGSPQRIEPLSAQEALVELVRHSYTVRLLEATGTAATHFLQCSTLVNKVPIRRLLKSQCLEDLPELARMVEEDLAQAVA